MTIDNLCSIIQLMNFNPFVNLLLMILTLYEWALIIYIVMGWLFYFDIINRGQPLVRKIYEVLNKVLEPILKHIRRIVPPVSGVDLSPIVMFLGIFFLQDLIVTYFYYRG